MGTFSGGCTQSRSVMRTHCGDIIHILIRDHPQVSPGSSLLREVPGDSHRLETIGIIGVEF